jgi:hypothetical protein
MIKRRSSLFTKIVLVSIAALFLGCASTRKFVPPPPVPEDKINVPERPAEIETHIMWDGFKRQMIQPGGDLFDLSRWMRKLVSAPKEAQNVNAFDEVDNSSWFTNRNFLRAMSPESLAIGPNTVDGPDQTNGWTVVRAKTLGVTPGFNIRDSRGDNYVIKLDPPGFNGLNSSAEVVTTKLLYAAGYNVPENFAVSFSPDILRLGENVSFTGSDGVKRAMTEQDLADIIAKVQLTPDGKIRAMASKYIDGRPIGPFFFKCTRHDDPNDLIPHEHHRELRGMRVIFAWLGHYDTNASNFLDGYVRDGDNSYVRHYLIDFGAALGSHPAGAKPADRGSEPYMDPVHMLNKSLELGLVRRPRDHQEPVKFPSVGRFSAENYHPKSFKFIFPTRAFEYYTPRDAYWGAKIVASFDETRIRAAVEAANYESQEIADYLVATLMKRREITCSYWFNRMPPFDHFVLNGAELSFQDIGVTSGLFRNPTRTIDSEYSSPGSSPRTGPMSRETRLLILQTCKAWLQTSRAAIELQLHRGKNWSNSVFAYVENTSDNLTLVGLRRCK